MTTVSLTHMNQALFKASEMEADYVHFHSS
jgi:hypothetical protein